MRNSYRARCYRCGGWVEPEAGVVTFERNPRRRWPELGFQFNAATLVEHHECAERYAGTDVHHLFKPDRSSR